MTRNVTGLGLFPVALDVAMAEFLASRNLVFVIVFLVFVDLILLVAFISAIFQRDKRNSMLRRTLTPLTEPAIIETAKTILAKFKVTNVSIYVTRPDTFRGPPALTIGISTPSLWFSDRMLKELSPSEIGEIIGHELAHLVKRHRIKILVIGLLYTLTGLDLVFFTISRILPIPALFLIGGLVLILAGHLLVVPYVRRGFEFDADEIAARTIGNPDELASALSRLNGLLTRSSQRGKGTWRKWGASHPPLSERISRLARLSSKTSGQ